MRLASRASTLASSESASAAVSQASTAAGAASLLPAEWSRNATDYEIKLRSAVVAAVARADFAMAHRSYLKLCIARNEWTGRKGVTDVRRVFASLAGSCHELLLECGVLVALASEPFVIDPMHKVSLFTLSCAFCRVLS
jgi:hypothetical protein